MRYAKAISDSMDALSRASDRSLDPPAEVPPCFDCIVGDVRAILTNELVRWYVPEAKADALFDESTIDAARELIREFGGPWQPCGRH
jgi:hypothetical protein